MTPRLEALLLRLQPVVREEMLKVCVPNCCVATVAVLCRVFRHYGFSPHPVPCSVVIRNARMVECRAKGMVVPVDPEPMQAWMRATGSHSVGIVPESAYESLTRGYKAFGGHLICQVQDTLVDASICQANRPQHKIELPPFIAMPALEKFTRGEEALIGVIAGCEVEYRPLDDQSWRSAPDWIDKRRYRETLNAIIERSRERRAVCVTTLP
jgi:hypothetical protein